MKHVSITYSRGLQDDNFIGFLERYFLRGDFLGNVTYEKLARTTLVWTLTSFATIGVDSSLCTGAKTERNE